MRSKKFRRNRKFTPRPNPSRDIQNPLYKQWKSAVHGRDKYKCQVCGGKRNIEAHHIQKWADYPHLRFVVSNGITLCKKCHKKVANKELHFAQLFNKILRYNMYEKIGALLPPDLHEKVMGRERDVNRRKS